MKMTQALRHPHRAQGMGVRQITAGDVASWQAPIRLPSNIRRGHLIGGMRDIARMGRKGWDPSVADMQRRCERRKHSKANRFHEALRSARTRLAQVQRHKEMLETDHAEMTSSHRRLLETYEELHAAHRDLDARSALLRQAGDDAQVRFYIMPMPLFIIDRKGKIRDVNGEAVAAIGTAGRDLVGSDFYALFTDPGHARAFCQNALRMDSVRRVPLEIRQADGCVTPVMCSAAPHQGEGLKVQDLLLALWDVSEQRQMEKKAAALLGRLEGCESQYPLLDRLTGLGLVSAEVARELLDPTGAVLDAVRRCLKQTDKGDEQYPLLQEIQHAVQSCVALLNRLFLALPTQEAGGEDYEKESCTVICDRVIGLFSSLAEKRGATINRYAARGTPRIWIRSNQIQQVIFNLLSNALDSIEDVPIKEIRVDIRSQGGFVQLTVSDTGCGIPPEQIERIFEPFFTTKPPAKGTGLGLPVGRSIVEAHGGSIACESESGKGTTVKVLLPTKKARI